jgi:hypothetical protein
MNNIWWYIMKLKRMKKLRNKYNYLNMMNTAGKGKI